RRYRPSASLVAVNTPPTSGAVAVIVAPGRTAFCSSYTWPRTDPYGDWAKTGALTETTKNAVSASTRLGIAFPLSHVDAFPSIHPRVNRPCAGPDQRQDDADRCQQGVGQPIARLCDGKPQFEERDQRSREGRPEARDQQQSADDRRGAERQRLDRR